MHFWGNTQNFYFSWWYITYSYCWDLNSYGITKSVIGTITMLETGRQRNRGLIPGGVENFSETCRPHSGAHPPPYSMCSGGCFPGRKSNHKPTST